MLLTNNNKLNEKFKDYRNLCFGKKKTDLIITILVGIIGTLIFKPL